MEAKVLEGLAAAVKPQRRVKLGSLLSDIGRRGRLSDDEFAAFEQVRSRAPARPVDFA